MALPGVNPTYRYLDDGAPDGTILGQLSTSKIGFWGSVPQVQLGSVTTVTTTAAVSHSSNWGYSTSVQAHAIVSAVNTVISRFQSIGVTA
mgnify:FL=1